VLANSWFLQELLSLDLEFVGQQLDFPFFSFVLLILHLVPKVF
jgi:hypothetical protein